MIYLDNAATTLKKPQEVIDAVVSAMTSMGNAGRGVNDGSLSAARVIFKTRDNLAKMFGAKDARQVAFTCNSTESLNTALKGLINPGDKVVSTALEHNSVLRPLYEMEEKGAEITFVGCVQMDDKNAILEAMDANKDLPEADRVRMMGVLDYDALEKAITDETKLVVCTHASNLTGNLLDLKRIGEMAKAHGALFVVDASQTAGVFPIDMKELGIDVLCFTGHKGLLGPQGTGGLCVREGLQIRPLKCGGTGIQTYNKKQPVEMPTALEAGTLNGHGLAGLGAATEYLEKTGIDSIREREQALMWRFYTGIKEIPGVKIYGDYRSKNKAAVVAVNIKDYSSGEVSDALLMDYEISTRSGGHCAPRMHQALGTVEQGIVRFSFSHFNTEEEIDIAINAIKELAEE